MATNQTTIKTAKAIKAVKTKSNFIAITIAVINLSTSKDLFFILGGLRLISLKNNASKKQKKSSLVVLHHSRE